MPDIALELDDIARMLGLRDMQIETLQKQVAQLPAPEPDGTEPVSLRVPRRPKTPPEDGPPAA